VEEELLLKIVGEDILGSHVYADGGEFIVHGSISGTAIQFVQAYPDGASTTWTATINDAQNTMSAGQWAGACNGTFTAIRKNNGANFESEYDTLDRLLQNQPDRSLQATTAAQLVAEAEAYIELQSNGTEMAIDRIDVTTAGTAAEPGADASAPAGMHGFHASMLAAPEVPRRALQPAPRAEPSAVFAPVGRASTTEAMRDPDGMNTAGSQCSSSSNLEELYAAHVAAVELPAASAEAQNTGVRWGDFPPDVNATADAARQI
jgi:hypothetical protein